MTYNVFGGTLNTTLLLLLVVCRRKRWWKRVLQTECSQAIDKQLQKWRHYWRTNWNT